MKLKTSHYQLVLKAYQVQSAHRNTCARQVSHPRYVRSLRTTCPHGSNAPFPTRKNCRQWMQLSALVVRPMAANYSVVLQVPGHIGVGSTVTLHQKRMLEVTMMRCVISLPVSVALQTALNGSTQVCIGRMESRAQHRAIGTLIQ